MEAMPAGAVAAIDSSVLQLIVQRACVNSTVTEILNLLLTSKTMYSAVLESCKGTVSVQLTSATAASAGALARWLAKYGQIVRHLKIGTDLLDWEESEDNEPEQAAIEQTLAASLQQAANNSNMAAAGAAVNSLHLASCELCNSGKGATAVLQQLPCQSLTKLTLWIVQPGSSTENPNKYIRCFSTSLSHLTNLRSLDLHFLSPYRYDACLDPMLHQLSGLTNLTCVSPGSIASDAALQSLPPSIKELSIDWKHWVHQLHLTHLTALTCLGPCLKLPEDCILPPSLISLSIRDLVDTSCLMPLQNLQVLKLCQLQEGYANLQQLSTLTALTRVGCYCSSLRERDVAGAIWKHIPVKHLEFADGSSSAMDVIGAIASLRHLQQLILFGLPIDGAAAPHLATSVAGQLRQLQLAKSGLNDSSLTVILQRSTQLVHLVVCGNTELTEWVLPVAAKLPRLRRMCHSITGTPAYLHLYPSTE